MKNRLISKLIGVEGGYVDDENDSGGKTNFGITESVAMENGYYEPINKMPRSVAFDIYSSEYWDTIMGDNMVEISELITEEVFDSAVNLDVSTSVRFLQRALNVFNNKGLEYPDLITDGISGINTLNALKKYLKYRDELILHRTLNCLQGAFYVNLAERREKDETFIYGWMKQRIK